MPQATLSLCRLPATWIDDRIIDDRVTAVGALEHVCDLEIQVPIGAKLLLNGLVRLLAVANQLSAAGVAVRLTFDEGLTGAMGYLDRIGFFDRLSSEIEVAPWRPTVSGALRHKGGNSGLIELEPIHRERDDHDLPDRLARSLVAACAARTDASDLYGATWTIFAELVSNFREHSGSDMEAVGGLQTYQNGNNVQVVVSDNGRGLMHTLRPELRRRDPARARLTDAELLVAMFRDGVSRFDDRSRGGGLKACAQKAMKLDARLDVRLETQDVRLRRSQFGYQTSTTQSRSGLASLNGTHIALAFRLT